MRDAPPRTQGYFLLLVQEKATKEKDTPETPKSPLRFSPKAGRPYGTSLCPCACALPARTLSGLIRLRLRCSGGVYGDPKNHKPSGGLRFATAFLSNY
jgi:hypothetical protein